MPASPLKILSVIPPMTQLNTPYPSTAYLTGFLRSRGFMAVQEDLALALVLRLFSPDGLRALQGCIRALPAKQRTQAVGRKQAQHQGEGQILLHRRIAARTQKTGQVGGRRVGGI